MKEPTLKRTKWSKFLHVALVVIIIAGFICTAGSFSQAVTTSNTIVSRVVNHDETLEFVRIGLVSLGITALALLVFAFSVSARSRNLRRFNTETLDSTMDANAELATLIKSCIVDLKQLKKEKAKPKKT